MKTGNRDNHAVLMKKKKVALIQLFMYLYKGSLHKGQDLVPYIIQLYYRAYSIPCQLSKMSLYNPLSTCSIAHWLSAVVFFNRHLKLLQLNACNLMLTSFHKLYLQMVASKKVACLSFSFPVFVKMFSTIHDVLTYSAPSFSFKETSEFIFFHSFIYAHLVSFKGFKSSFVKYLKVKWNGAGIVKNKKEPLLLR